MASGRGDRLDQQPIAPPPPFKGGWVAIVINISQQVKLLDQGALGIKAGISRPAATIMTGFTVLGAGFIN